MEAKLAEKDAELEQLRDMPAPEPERIEVPIVPPTVLDALAEIAAQAEAGAANVEEQTAE